MTLLLLLPLDSAHDIFFVAKLRTDRVMIEVVVAGDAHFVLVAMCPAGTKHVILLSGPCCRLQLLVHHIVILAQFQESLLVLSD